VCLQVAARVVELSCCPGSTGDGAHTPDARAGERTSENNSNSNFDPVGMPAGGTLSSFSNCRM